MECQRVVFADSSDAWYDNPPQPDSLVYFPIVHAGWYFDGAGAGRPDEGTAKDCDGVDEHPDTDAERPDEATVTPGDGNVEDPVVFDDVTPPVRASDIAFLQSGVLMPTPGLVTGGGRRGPRSLDRWRRDRLQRQERWERRRQRVAVEKALAELNEEALKDGRAFERARSRRRAAAFPPAAARWEGPSPGQLKAWLPFTFAGMTATVSPRAIAIARQEVDGRVVVDRDDPGVRCDLRFCALATAKRRKHFRLSDDAIKILEASRVRRKPVLHFRSRKSHNRLTHALNGNTAAFPAARETPDMRNLTDTSGDVGVLGLFVAGMRRAGEHAPFLSYLARQALSDGAPVEEDDITFVIPGSTEYLSVVFLPDLLALNGASRLQAQAPVLAVVELAMGLDRVSYALEYVAQLARRDWRCMTLFCDVGRSPFALSEVNGLARSLARLGVPVLGCDARPPAWHTLRVGCQALTGEVRVPPWLSDAPRCEFAEVGDADEDRPVPPVGSASQARIVIDDSADPVPPAVCFATHATQWDLEMVGIEGYRGLWISAEAALADLEDALASRLGAAGAWYFSVDGHPLQPNALLVEHLGRTLRATPRTRGGAPKAKRSAARGSEAAGSSSLGGGDVRAALRVAAEMAVETVDVDPTPAAAGSPVEEMEERVLTPPDGRPTLIVEHERPVDPPQVGLGDPVRVPVQADGNCLYYCVVAARDTAEWLVTHDERGVAVTVERAKADLEAAHLVRDALCAILRAESHHDQARRLEQSGPDAYPGYDELEGLSRVVGGSIVLQSGPGQVVMGSGPLKLHVLHCVRRDGRGHGSPHWELYQSWLPRPIRALADLDIPAVVAGPRAATSTEVALELRRNMPGAQTSELEFQDFLDAVTPGMQTLGAQLPDPPRDVQGVIEITSNWWAKVTGKFPAWEPELVHLAVGALAMRSLRGNPSSHADRVLFVYVALGLHNSVLRAHSGDVWCWHKRGGAWQMHDGSVPFDHVRTLKAWLLRLEGLLRCFVGHVLRDEDDILDAVDGAYGRIGGDLKQALSHFEETALSSSGGGPPSASGRGRRGRGRRGRGNPIDSSDPGAGHAADGAGVPGADDPEDDGHRHWYLVLAKRLVSLGGHLEDAMTDRKFLDFFAMWCDTVMPSLLAVAYLDAAYGYDAAAGEALRRLPDERRRDIYVLVPHNILSPPLDDPLLKEAMEKVWSFYKQTFWSNAHGLRCCFAALALAKRRQNVTQMFMLWGTGGVGLSLTTAHLQAMLGRGSHRYFDPQMFHMDDELRKQVELLRGSLVMTAQEKPDSMRQELRLDQWKKVASGDSLFGRLPYATITRVINLIGWKRMEVNSLLKFTGVTPESFHSIFRRCLLIRIKSRFIPAPEMRRLEAEAGPAFDPYAVGVFQQQPDLKQFLCSDLGVAAGLRHQHGFERKYGQAACEALLTSYTYGGLDGGITEKYIREACKLDAPLTQAVGPDGIRCEGAGPVGISLLPESQQETATGVPVAAVDPLRPLLPHIVRQMHEREYNMLTSGFWVNIKLPPSKMTGAKASVWEKILESPLFLHAPRSSAVKPGVFPRIEMGHGLAECCPVAVHDALVVDGLTLTESYDVASYCAYYGGRGGTAHVNLEILTKVMSTAATKRPGRNSFETATLGELLADTAASLTAQHSTMLRLIDLLEIPERRQEEKDARRRLEDGTACPAGFVTRSVHYRAKEHGARLIAQSVGAQGLPRRGLLFLLPHTVDLDMVNAIGCVVSQLLDRLQVMDSDAHGDEIGLIKDLAARRDALLQEHIASDRVTAKKLMLGVLSGQAIPDAWAGDAFLRRVRKAARFLRWTACTVLPDVHAAKATIPGKWAAASTFAIMWQRVESYLLTSWVRWIESVGSPVHLSLHHDGVRIDRAFVEAASGSVEGFIAASTAAIRERTGFHVQLVEKQHRCVFELLETMGDNVAVDPVPEVGLHAPGNCIPLALYRLRDILPSGADALWTTKELSRPDVMVRGVRTYRSAIAIAGAAATPHFGFSPKYEGAYLVHMELRGKPHAVGVRVNKATDTVTVYLATSARVMRIGQFQECVAGAVDHKLIVTLHVAAADRPPPSIYSAADRVKSLSSLLDLQAGAGDSEEGSMERPLPVDAPLSESMTLARQDLLRALCEEVAEYERLVATECARRVRVVGDARRGGRRCRLCPFLRFRSAKTLLDHLRQEHTRERHFVAAGRKTLGVVYALRDHDALAGHWRGAYLARAAAIIRQCISPELSPSRVDIDRCMVMLLTCEGPTYTHADAVVHRRDLRRVGYTYYDRGFGELAWREALLSHGRVRPMLTRLIAAMVASGTELVGLLSRYVPLWLGIVEDLFRSPMASSRRKDTLAFLFDDGEFAHLSVDATIRVLRRARGQADYRSSRATRNAAAIADVAAKRRVLTVLGRTSIPLAAPLVRDESADSIAAALGAAFTRRHLAAVVSVRVDQPSGVLWRRLREVLPALRLLVLDPVHVCMVYESCHYRKRTEGGSALRRIMRKFFVSDPMLDEHAWGAAFCGEREEGGCAWITHDATWIISNDCDAERPDAAMLTPRLCRMFREAIEESSMALPVAKRILDAVDPRTPWRSADAFAEALAAHSAVYAGELRRKTHQAGVTLARLLSNLVAPARVQWLFNGLRALHAEPPHRRQLMPTGTTGNEAFHSRVTS